MATTTTTRLGLVKPTPGTGEPVNRGTENANLDKIDTAIGATVCTEGTKPAFPWDGQFIRCTDSRKLYMWNATQANWDQITVPLGGAMVGAVSNTDLWKGQITGDTNNRLSIQAGGALFWGAGNAAQDTNLYRSAANRLKTDDDFEVTGQFINSGIGYAKPVYKTAFQDKTNTTALGNDNHLTFANVASAAYTFRLNLFVIGAIAGDVKVGFTFPTGAGGATITWAAWGGDPAGGGQVGSVQGAGFFESTTVDQTLAFHAHPSGALVRIEGYISFGTTIGALTLRWAQNTANATATSIREGSNMIYTKVV